MKLTRLPLADARLYLPPPSLSRAFPLLLLPREHRDGAALEGRDIDVLAILTHGHGARATQSDPIGAGHSIAHIRDTAIKSGQLGQDAGGFVTGKHRDGIAKSGRDIDMLAVGAYRHGGNTIQSDTVSAGHSITRMRDTTVNPGQLSQDAGGFITSEYRHRVALRGGGINMFSIRTYGHITSPIQSYSISTVYAVARLRCTSLRPGELCQRPGSAQLGCMLPQLMPRATSVIMIAQRPRGD